MSIARTVKHYVIEHAFVHKALRQHLLNYSSLARKIIKDCSLSPKDFGAIVVALRRIQDKHPDMTTRKIARILQESHLEIRTGIVVFIIEKEYLGKKVTELHARVKDAKGSIHVIEGVDVMTIITTTDCERLVTHYFRSEIISKQGHLVELILRSPQFLENTPGVTSYLCGLLAERDVNIVEMMSCWTDTIFIIAENDLEKAVAAFSVS
ncbi:MAG: hypothetical protein V1725_06505 [archaeon]